MTLNNTVPYSKRKDKDSVRILHLDAGSPECSVAISEDGLLLHSTFSLGDPIADFSGLVKECFKNSGFRLNDIAAISVTSGPGSYTGLRSGISFAKGLCVALNIPLLAIPTLESWAWAAIEQSSKDLIPLESFGVIMHTRRNQFVGATYNQNTETLGSLIEGDLDHFEFWSKLQALGFSRQDESIFKNITHPHLIYINPQAFHQVQPAYKLFKLGHYSDLNQFNPVYLFDPYITIPKQKLS